MENHSNYLPQVTERLPIPENELRDHRDVDMPLVGSSVDPQFSHPPNQSGSSPFDQPALNQATFDQSAISAFNRSDDLSAIQAANVADSSLINRSTSSFGDSAGPSSVANAANTAMANTVDSDLISCAQLADYLLKTDTSSPLYILIDSRSFIEYNSCHIQEALNVCCSKIIKRRLQNDKVIAALLVYFRLRF